MIECIVRAKYNYSILQIDSDFLVYISGDSPKDKYCLMGKFGSLVTLNKLDGDINLSHQELEDISRQLCQHVVGMNPKSMGYGEEPKANKDDERRLLLQEFLLDPTLTVHEFMNSKGVEMIDFVRFECGEADPEE